MKDASKFSTSHPNQMCDPAAALQSAILNLEQFACKKRPHSFKDLITPIFSSSARAKREKDRTKIRTVVLQAISTIKSHHFFIEKLQCGNAEERQLAASVFLAIKQYHLALDHTLPAPNDWSKRIKRFFSEEPVIQNLRQYRIDLPQEPISHLFFAKQGVDNEKIRLTFQSSIKTDSSAETEPLLAQEIDALRMKAITLMRQQGIQFKTAAEGLSSIKNAPIQAAYDVETHVSSLCLNLELLPGMTISVKGSFRRERVAHSTPIPDSFQLHFEAGQTGFPFPSQSTGWALSGSLIPAYPHQLDMLPLFKQLYEKKKAATAALLPNGKFLDAAKYLLRIKTRVFNEHRLEFLRLHRQLSFAILSAVSEEGMSPNSKQIIDRYYDELEADIDPFRHLSETFFYIGNNYITRPYMKLQNTWLERSNEALFDQNLSQRYLAAEKNLKEEQQVVNEILLKERLLADSALTQNTIDFIRCIGGALGSSIRAIILQYMSETLKCAPRMLDDFSQMVQLAAYTQLENFLEEIEWEIDRMPLEEASILVKKRMLKQINDDISLFKTSDFDSIQHRNTDLVEELESYFNTCYYATLD